MTLGTYYKASKVRASLLFDSFAPQAHHLYTWVCSKLVMEMASIEPIPDAVESPKQDELSRPYASLGEWKEHEGYHILNIWHAPRWKISQWMLKSPFTYRMPIYIPILPGNFKKTGMSIGELLVVLLTLGILLVKLNHGKLGIEPSEDDLEETGKICAIFLMYTFATAAHNSIFSILFGLPFERAMFWHAWFAILACIAGIYHGLLILIAKGNISDS